MSASLAASAQVVGSLGGGTGSFLALSGGSSPSAWPDGCTATAPCLLGGTVATIVGGAILNGDTPFADADAFNANGGIFGSRFLATGPTLGNTTTLTFTAPVNYVSFLWGSPDQYNLLTVNSIGGSRTFDTSTGIHPGTTSLMLAPADGNQSFAQYVQFMGTGITSLVFTNAPGIDAFEVANFSVVAAVPEPETYALMLTGLGALAFVSRRRKRN